MESLLLLSQLPKLPGRRISKGEGCRIRSGHYSSNSFPTQASLFRNPSIGRGDHQKCCLGNVRERRESHGRRDKKWEANTASGRPLELEADAQNDSNSVLDSVKSAADAFYRFSRPHTIIGTALSIVSVSLLAIQNMTDLSPVFFTGVLEAIVAAICMNIYVVGLNQLTDIEIDKVNKPYLPVASGEYSIGTGTLLVLAFSILSFLVSWFVGSWPLFWAIFLAFLLGTGYSVNLPLLRWKRFAVAAAMCIWAVRAIVVQLAFFLHIQAHVFQRQPVFSNTLIFAVAFMSFFSVVIALFKDIPDIEGDKTFGIRSFTVRLGQKRVFWICIALLEMAYAIAILFGSMSSNPWCKATTVIGHAILASILSIRARSLDLGSKDAITSFYMFIWKLFYAEYFLMPLFR